MAQVQHLVRELRSYKPWGADPYPKIVKWNVYETNTTLQNNYTLIKINSKKLNIPTECSLVAQLVKDLPATQETWVPSLGWEDPLEKGTATHSSILACIVREVTKQQTQLNHFHFHTWKNTYMEMQRTLDSLNNSEKGPTKVRQILPDLQTYHKATVKQNMGLWSQRSKEQDTEHGHGSARSQSPDFQQVASAVQQGEDGLSDKWHCTSWASNATLTSDH